MCKLANKLLIKRLRDPNNGYNAGECGAVKMKATRLHLDAANEIERQADELSKLRVLLNDVHDDLLLRASIGGQGEKVVSIGATIWNRICALRGEQS